MKRLLILSLLFALPLTAAEPTSLTKEETKEGWKLLFNGKDLEGWRQYGSDQGPGPGWQVKDGVLVKVGGGNGGNIITKEKFTNYELSWEWNISRAGNNGIKYLVIEERPSALGPEYQLLDDENHPDSKHGVKRHTAALYDILPAAEDKPLNKPGEWNHSQIIVKGKDVEHWLNGKKVLEYKLGSRELEEAIAKSKFANDKGFGEKVDGHIMLTDHHDSCSFRNLKIRPLPGGKGGQ